MTNRMRKGAWMLLLGLLLTTANGCGGANNAGTVSGTVTFQGKPMPGGYVNFFTAGPDGNIVDQKSSSIDEKGNYSVAKVHVGDAKITVQAPVGEVQSNITEKGGMPMPSGPLLTLPQKYGMVEETDLKYTVKPGNQTHDIALK